MRHPSIDLSPSPIFTRDCTEISVNSSRELLRLTDNLRRGNHYLDTTWYGATVQLLATLTILFSVWDKRNTVTAEEIAEVQRDMDLCMDIMGDLGRLLGTSHPSPSSRTKINQPGSPTRLRDVVQALTVRTMEFLTTPSKPTPPPPPQPFTTPYPPLTAVPMKLSSLGDYPAPSYTYPPPPPPDPFEPPPPQDAGVFPWGWNGNESWRQYMQNIGSIVESLDPSETYASSALIALGQDCNGGGGGGGAPAAPAEGWEWAPQGGAGST